MSNIEAAKALADAVRTSLGPRGMDKMVRLIAQKMPCTEHTRQWHPMVLGAGVTT